MSAQHIDIARAVRDAIGAADVINVGGPFWRWRDRGVWARIEDAEIKQAIHRELDNKGKWSVNFTRSTVDSILDLIRTESRRFEHHWNPRGDVINTATGLLAWDERAQDWRCEPHRREDFVTVQIPVAYDPEARCPRFLQFLDEVFAGDADAPAKAAVITEMIGYSLLTTCRYERFILLIGGGANGKTVLLKIVEALVGAEMVCAVQPSQLDNKFQRAHLAGKLVNIVTEIAEGAEIADAQLKAIVSGELTTAEHKHRPPFDFHPFATCWFATNHMPHSRDFSDAMFRRAIVLSFNNRFDGERCDPRLFEKLRAELPGILNVALAAIRGVMIRGAFTSVASSHAAKREWQLQCDQAAQYFEERCERRAGAKVGSSTLYQDYREWAQEQGVSRVLTQKSFVQRLCTRYGLELRRDKSLRYVHGADLRTALDASISITDFRSSEAYAGDGW